MADIDETESEGLISRDDIDQLLRGMEEIGDTVEADAPSGDELDTDDLVSQDEIDKLLGLVDFDDDSAGDASSDEGEAELISQDDIDMLLRGMESPDEASDDIAPAEDEDLEMVSMADIESLFKSEFQDLAGENAATVPEADTFEEESLISQDDIDSLLAGMDSDVTPAPDDLNDLLGDGPDSGSYSAGDEESLITQDDIDSLLNEAVADEVFAGGDGGGQRSSSEDLVSQDDIDRLLMGDMEEEEPSAEEISPAPEAGRVILEDTDDIDSSGDEKKSGKKWYKSFKVLIAASVVLLLSVSGTLFFLFSGGEEPDFAVIVPSEQIETAVAKAPEEPVYNFSRGEKITTTLIGFIVPAPLNMKGVSFIAADISIEFIDVSSNPLQGYEPFFRNIIYDVLRKALVLNDKSLIVEADLKRMIQKAVNDALTEGAVEKVDFISFKIG